MYRILCAVIALMLLAVRHPLNAQPALTLEQRVGQMFMATVHGAQLPESGRDFLQRWQPGAVVLFTSNITTPAQITQLTNSYQQAIQAADGWPLLIATDQEGGVVQRLAEGFTTWPVPTLITATDNPTLQAAYGAALATELSAVGINMNLAPVADLEHSPDNPIIQRRSFGSDPAITGRTLAQIVSGMQSAGVAATLKHFPGHGAADRDSHVEMPVVDLPTEALYAGEIASFQQALDADAVMVAHIWYPQLEPEANLPASLSRRIVTNLLRDELGYTGIIMTDAMDMDAIDRQYSPQQAAVMAVQAGVDMIAVGPGTGLETQAAMIQAVIDAVQRGDIPEARIDESVARIRALKLRYGLFDWQPLAPASVDERLQTEAHAALLDDVFQAGVTVAYDNAGLLPLHPQDRNAIVYLGIRNNTVTECSQYQSDIIWASAARYPDDADIQRAVDAASRADKVVVFTYNTNENPVQQALVNALPPEKTIAVALASPYDWQYYPDVAAYMLTYSPLFQSIPAACAALFGQPAPTGILPVTLGPALPAGSHAQP